MPERTTHPSAHPTAPIAATTLLIAEAGLESSQPDEPPEHAKLACDWQAGVSLLGCQLRRPNSLVEGAMWAAGRSLPGMSLAFALMAAINGSTGSCATLSHGL
jgi:hypothetical protein